MLGRYPMYAMKSKRSGFDSGCCWARRTGKSAMRCSIAMKTNAAIAPLVNVLHLRVNDYTIAPSKARRMHTGFLIHLELDDTSMRGSPEADSDVKEGDGRITSASSLNSLL